MNITSARYNQFGAIVAVIDGVELYVPDDMSNRERAALEEWGGVIAPYVPPVIPLAEIKTALKSAVDVAAETERNKYITPGSGQAMTYQAKASEAVLYSRVGGDEADYPMLSSEIGITGENLHAVAELVLSMHNQWLLVGSQIETVRLAAKAEIDAAGTEEEARAVNPVWP